MRKTLLLCVVLLLGAGLAGATTLVKMDFRDLARDAESVVVGTVTDIRGDWDPSGTFIHSEVTILVDRTLNGKHTDQVVLRTPGGSIGATGQRAEGAAEFEIGERVLVFLTRWDDGAPKVLGYTQGKSSVSVDNLGRERLIGGSANGMAVDAAALEILHGSEANIPLRPAR